ncbi:FAA hydrolase family protein [bacterium]|nr:MAG: FAA hydrolase family protein [bacterium]
MAAYVFPPAEPVSLPILGTDERFPVRRVYCVGQNYADHVKEMGGDGRQPPFFFAKPTDAINLTGEFPYPPASDNVHHEVELLVAIGPDGIFGYGVALDMTRRDMQTEAKKTGRPWEAAKGFDGSAPCGPLTRDFDPSEGAIWIDVNGERRQSADLHDLIWSVPEVVAELSKLFELKPGDVILTGTPAGVGPVVPGDIMRAGIDGLGELTVRVVPT